jgi:hypothetical protein
MLECVRALDETPLVGVLQTLLASDMTQAENAELDRFFSSVPGQKYERLGQLAIYTSNGKPAPEPNPEFSPAESAALDAFSKTTAGRKYLFERWVEKPSVQAALQERLQGLYRDCRSKT